MFTKRRLSNTWTPNLSPANTGRKPRIRRSSPSLMAATAGLLTLSVTGTVLGNGFGHDTGITPELTARWWEWVTSIPSSVNPLSQKNIDPTGADYCMVGQQGKEWFFGGVFKTVDISPELKPAQIAPIEVVRECHVIPLGKSILIPVLNAECNTAEELALGNEVPENLHARIGYLKDCARIQADAVNPDTTEAFFGPVDSLGNWSKNPVKVKRVHTVRPFSMAFSPDNILSRDCGGLEPFFCDPDPNPSLAEADGYWAQVRPFKPGKYKLETFGEAPQFDFALRVIYTLTVVGPQDQ